MKALALLAILACSAMALEGYLSVTPKNIIARNLLPGSTYMAFIKVEHGGLDARLELVGESSGWLAVSSAKGGYMVTINVPESAPPGVYEAGINVLGIEGEESGISTHIAVPVYVRAEVTDRMAALPALKRCSVVASARGLSFLIDAENMGNVPASVSKANATITDSQGRLVARVALDGARPLPAFSRETQILESSIKLGNGQYWASVDVDAGGTVLRDRVAFDKYTEPFLKRLVDKLLGLGAKN